MKTINCRNIYQGNSLVPFSFSKKAMNEPQYKLSVCANKLAISPKKYLEYLQLVDESPIAGPLDKTQFIKESTHRKVESLFVQKTEPVNEVNEEKDLKKVIHQMEKKLKKDFSVSKKRNLSGFYTPAKIKEWEIIVKEVNKQVETIHFIDKKIGTEIININFFRYYKFLFNPEQKIPVLKIKKHPRYGMELYLELPINQEEKNSGVKSFKKTRFRITSDLNNLSNPEDVYSYAFRLIVSVFLKIKAGYFLKHAPMQRSMKFIEVENLPIGKHFLIPTLYVYLEHFKSVNSITEGMYSIIKSDLNTLTKFINKLPRRLQFDLNELEHNVKFLQFDRIFANKFLEFLQSDTDTKTGKPITGTTKRNIFSSMGNLVNKIIKMRADLQNPNYTNPFLKHEIKKSLSETHITYTLDQLNELEEALEENNETQLLLFVNFLYHTGIRPIEAKRLKIKHLDNLDEGLYLPANITKNGLPRTVPVNDYLLEVLYENNVSSFAKEDYLFSSCEGIGPQHAGKNFFSRKFKLIRDKCPNLTAFHTLYSLRHTFAFEYMKQAKTDKKFEARSIELMDILGHAKFDTTQKYLKGFGRDFSKTSNVKGMKHWKK